MSTPDEGFKDKEFDVLSGMWYWDRENINAIADKRKQGCSLEDYKEVTTEINKQALGNKDRKQIFDNAINILSK